MNTSVHVKHCVRDFQQSHFDTVAAVLQRQPIRNSTMSTTHKRTTKHYPKTGRAIENAAAKTGDACAKKVQVIVAPLSKAQWEAKEASLAAIDKSKTEILEKVDDAKEGIELSLKGATDKIIQSGKENTEALSRKIDSLESQVVTLKESKRALAASIQCLKDDATDVLGHVDLIVATGATYEASGKTADDKDVFIEHILADIAALAELCSEQEAAKSDKGGKGGRSLINIFGGKN